MAVPHTAFPDAYTPAEMAQRVETVGVVKARADVLTTLPLAVLAGAFISLGALFFHMLVGAPPFRGESAIAVFRKHEEEPLPPQASLPPSVSQSVYQIVPWSFVENSPNTMNMSIAAPFYK